MIESRLASTACFHQSSVWLVTAVQPAASATPVQPAEASAPADSTITLGELVTGLGHDLTRLPSIGNAEAVGGRALDIYRVVRLIASRVGLLEKRF